MYAKGDILADFQRRVFFIYPGPENFPRLKLYKCRLATPGEAMIFNREFKTKTEVTFRDFKKKMPTFDGRRLRNMVYGYIALSEHNFLFFRSMQVDRYSATEIPEKLQLLIINYLNPVKHNPENEKEAQQLKQLKTLLSEILKDTNP